MRRFFLKILVVLAVLLVLVLGAGAWLVNDETFLKNQVAKYVLEYTGRELVVAGPLDVQLGTLTKLEARDIRFENAPWAQSPDMLRIGHLQLTVNIPSLFQELPYLPFILLENCQLDLETNESGEDNWDVFLDEEDTDSGLVDFLVDDLLINDCRLSRDSPQHETPLLVHIESAHLDRKVGNRLEAKLSGTINEDRLKIDGWLEPASAFIHGGSLDYELSLQSGPDELELSGSFAELDTLAQPEFTGHYHGPEITGVLGRFGLPPVADGPFDVRARLETRDDRVVVEVYGDVGSLDLTASGELDRLLQPGAGYITTWAAGPNLGALGEVLGVQGLVAEPFDWIGDIRFHDDIIEVEGARLGTALDEAKLSGRFSTVAGMPNSEATLSVKTEELSRWAHLLEKSWQRQGAFEAEAQVNTDPAGILSIDAQAKHGQSELQASGQIGTLAGPYEPDIEFSFQSTDMPRLVGLFSETTFPDGDLRVNGHFRKSGRELLIDDFETFLDGHRVSAGGRIMLEKNYAGSDIDIHLEIPDLAAFGRLFGRENLPAERVLINGSLKPVGEGLAIQVENSEVGKIHVSFDAEIADLDEPTGIDAEFKVQFPDEKILAMLVPNLGVPEGAVTVSGGLVNEDDRTVVHEVLLVLGENRLAVDGALARDGSFDLDVGIEGPNAGDFSSMIGTHPGNVPYAVTARVHGSPAEFTISGLSAKVGKSVAAGDITIVLSDVTRISGSIKSPYLNISTWTEKDEEDTPEPDPPATGKKKTYVFDETPVMQITGLGVEIDMQLEADTLDLGESRIDDLGVDFVLRDNLIQARPFKFRDMRGALLSGEFTLDSQGPKPALNVNLLAEDFHPLIGAKEGQDPATLPAGDFRLTLTSNGETRREMASNLDGEIRIRLGPGKLAASEYAFLMTDFLGQLFDTLNPNSEVKEYTSLECAVGAADIQSGLATIRPVVLHAEQLTIVIEGTIDLNTEKLDISFNSKQRKGLGVSATDLVNPFIKVGGTLAAPSLILDPASTVVKGGIAVATMGVSILANSLAERFLSSKDPCGDAIRKIEKRDNDEP